MRRKARRWARTFCQSSAGPRASGYTQDIPMMAMDSATVFLRFGSGRLRAILTRAVVSKRLPLLSGRQAGRGGLEGRFGRGGGEGGRDSFGDAAFRAVVEVPEVQRNPAHGADGQEGEEKSEHDVKH